MINTIYVIEHLEKMKKILKENNEILKMIIDSDVFSQRVEDLELSVRSRNALKQSKIIYVRDLVSLTERTVLSIPNLGRNSFKEVKGLLTEMGLTFGMEFPDDN